MRLGLCILLNVIISSAISLSVMYYAPGYALSPREQITSINGNTLAISKLADSLLEVIKRMNEVAPPSKPKEVKKK